MCTHWLSLSGIYKKYFLSFSLFLIYSLKFLLRLQMGTYETIPNVDRILSHLAPIDSANASEEDFEGYFATLEVADKLQIMKFLINNVAKTTLIHEHIEGCVSKQTELNKEKNEIAREKKHM